MTDAPNGWKHFPLEAPIKTAMEGDFDTGNVRFKGKRKDIHLGSPDPRGILFVSRLLALSSFNFLEVNLIKGTFEVPFFGYN